MPWQSAFLSREKTVCSDSGSDILYGYAHCSHFWVFLYTWMIWIGCSYMDLMREFDRNPDRCFDKHFGKSSDKCFDENSELGFWKWYKYFSADTWKVVVCIAYDSDNLPYEMRPFISLYTIYIMEKARKMFQGRL